MRMGKKQNITKHKIMQNVTVVANSIANANSITKLVTLIKR